MVSYSLVKSYSDNHSETYHDKVVGTEKNSFYIMADYYGNNRMDYD